MVGGHFARRVLRKVLAGAKVMRRKFLVGESAGASVVQRAVRYRAPDDMVVGTRSRRVKPAQLADDDGGGKGRSEQYVEGRKPHPRVIHEDMTPEAVGTLPPGAPSAAQAARRDRRGVRRPGPRPPYVRRAW